MSLSHSDTSALPRCLPKKRASRVSFASLDSLSSPEKDACKASDDLPPSPCRAQRRLSFAKEVTLSDVADACSVADALPSSPPDSPGRYRQVWLCLRQREEELGGKQRQLEEWDFELQEEKRQHRESRLFLARKMSELEARELRAAKEEERRLSRVSTFSGSQTSSMERSPPPSSTKMRTHLLDTPPNGMNLSGDVVESSTQTAEYDASAALGDTRKQTGKCTCRRLLPFGIILFMALKICILVGIFLVPELPSQTVEHAAAWLPVSFNKFVSLDDWSGDSAACGNCTKVLNETRLMLATLQQMHQELQQKHVAGFASDYSWQTVSLWARSLFGWD